MSSLIRGFEQYLKEKNFTAESIMKYTRRVQHFIEWVETEHITEVNYNELLAYVNHCQTNQRSTATINKYLLSVRHFFDYLDKQNNRWLNPSPGFNPAQNLQLRGEQQTGFYDPLTKEELETLHQQYEGNHQALVGLLLYQGLRTGEMEKLEKVHINLNQAKIYIPPTRSGQSRIMKLAAEQIIALSEQIRNQPGELLLGNSLQNRVRSVLKKFRAINSKVRTAKHIRGSLIVYWIKVYNLREAQYLAGHKNIISTELYQQADIEGLKEQLKRYHPLK